MKRRSGRPWDESVFAGPEKNVYCAATSVNLLASSIEEKNKNSSKNRSLRESVDSTMAQYSLQTYLDQVKMYENLLQPIANIMEKVTNPVQRPVEIEELVDLENSESANGEAEVSLEQAEQAREEQAQEQEEELIEECDMGLGELGVELVPALRMIGVIKSEKPPSTTRRRRSTVIESKSSPQQPQQPFSDETMSTALVISKRSSISSSSSSKRSSMSSPSSSSKSSSNNNNNGIEENEQFLSTNQSNIEEFNNTKSSPQRIAATRDISQRRERRRKNRKTTAIPWALLDELDGEKLRFQNEKSYFEFNNKFMQK